MDCNCESPCDRGVLLTQIANSIAGQTTDSMVLSYVEKTETSQFTEVTNIAMASPSSSSESLVRFAAGFAILFGAITILSGGIALFSEPNIRVLFGDVVRFVLVFNFASGFVYVLAGFGLWNHKRWAVRTSVCLFLAIVFVFAILALHILDGAAFEMRTVIAMSLRTAAWLLISFVAIRRIGWN